MKRMKDKSDIVKDVNEAIAGGQIQGGGTKLYRHLIHDENKNIFVITLINTDPTPLITDELITDAICEAPFGFRLHHVGDTSDNIGLSDDQNYFEHDDDATALGFATLHTATGSNPIDVITTPGNLLEPEFAGFSTDLVDDVEEL